MSGVISSILEKRLRFREVHKRGMHTHTQTHKHDDSIRRNTMRCTAPKNGESIANRFRVVYQRGTYMHIYTYTHMHTPTPAHTKMHTHIYTHIRTHIHTHTHMHAFTHALMYANARAPGHAQTQRTLRL